MNTTPYRLYKGITPVSDTGNRSSIFIRQVEVGNYFPVVQCQAMWATAYLDKKLVLPTREEQEKKLRYLRRGVRHGT